MWPRPTVRMKEAIPIPWVPHQWYFLLPRLTPTARDLKLRICRALMKRLYKEISHQSSKANVINQDGR